MAPERRSAAPDTHLSEDPAADPVEGEDYYLDPGGLLVFTAHYLRRRGHCCFQGCRHCPWGQAGRTRAEAFADLQRRLDALEERLTKAGLPLELRGYADGVLHVQPQDGACLTDRPALERALRQHARELLTVAALRWE